VGPAAGVSKIDPSLGPLSAFLGTLGMPGMTAYVGLKKIAKLQSGETLLVSAASGAVGAVACQIGKNLGCRVVGSAGSHEKATWLEKEAGVDVAINYKSVDDLESAIADACPDGIDVYFENVGGDHLVAALNLMNLFGRIALCGMIAMYNEPIPGPPNLAVAIGRQLRIQGFIVSSYWDLYPQFLKEMGEWISKGKLKWKETVVQGLEQAPDAFLGLFKGENFGKMIVKLAEDEK
jgi:NADPH-dependent curcumin reductase CurA